MKYYCILKNNQHLYYLKYYADWQTTGIDLQYDKPVYHLNTLRQLILIDKQSHPYDTYKIFKKEN